MVIRQRRTILDPFLLKVVFPYLDSGNHKTLLRLAGYWNVEVRKKQATRRVREWREVLRESFGTYAERYQRALRALARSFQPQALVPIALTHERVVRQRPTPDDS